MGPPGGYPPPVVGMYQPWQAPGPPNMQGLPYVPSLWPVPPQQDPPAPWWGLLLGGLGLGSALAFLGSLVWQKKVDHAIPEFQRVAPQWVDWEGHAVQVQQGFMAPGGQSPLEWSPLISSQMPSTGNTRVVQPVQVTPAIDQAVGHDSGGTERKDIMTKGQLKELNKLMRAHVEQTRETTASLKRTLEFQQRQFVGAFADFQRKLEEASRKKSNVAQRVEISPESLQMLRDLISKNSSSNCGNVAVGNGIGDGNGEVLGQWLDQVNDSLQRLLRSTGSKPEAKRSLQTVSMIVHNIVTNPTEEKYREVNPSSIRFQETFGGTDGSAAKLLQLAGFEFQNEVFMFSAERSLDQAQRVRDFLQDALRSCDQRWEQAHDSIDLAEAEAASKAKSDGSSTQAITGQPLGLQLAAQSCPKPTVGTSSSSCSKGTTTHFSMGSHQAGGTGGLAEAPKASAPWFSSVVQKQLSRKPLAGGITKIDAPNQVASAASMGGTLPAPSGRDPAPLAPIPAHPAEAQMSSQEPQSGG